MNDFLDNQIRNVLNKEEKIPESVMKKINISNDIIREKGRKSKAKTANFRKRYVMIASVIILIVGISSYKPVFAAVRQFLFGINDKGLQSAVDHNYMQRLANVSTEADSLKIEATNIVIDPSKLGIILKLNFRDTSVLKNVDNVWLDLTIRDERGNIIYKDGSGVDIISGYSGKADLNKKDSGEVINSIILDSRKAKIPETSSLSLEINDIILYENSQAPKKLTGNWALNIPLEEVFANRKTIKYSPINDNKKLEVISAEAFPTGFLVKFTVENNKNDENIVNRAKLVDKTGKEYGISIGADMENLPGNKDLITATFDATSFDDLKDLKLKIQTLDGKDEFVTLKREK
ncbi:MAG: hypothetical protein Q8936_10670 [Bacillota bacterium]|nr:hypothetical protein [Bacillota bacterium]